MSPDLGQAAFRLAIFIVLVAIGLLFIVPRGTHQFTVTVLSLIIGLIFMALVAILIRLSNR